MILAIDCDLRTSYGVREDGVHAHAPNPRALLQLRNSCHTVLFEIASPVSFNRGASGHAAMTQLAKWAIWNVASAMDLAHRIQTSQFLVAPSNVWTRGYDLKTRHLIAKCKQKQKDLRECEAMIFMYKQRPQDWKPLPEYLAAL